jgi:hypothetical protein
MSDPREIELLVKSLYDLVGDLEEGVGELVPAWLAAGSDRPRLAAVAGLLEDARTCLELLTVELPEPGGPAGEVVV